MKSLSFVLALCSIGVTCAAQMQTPGAMCVPASTGCGCAGCPALGDGMGQANYMRTPPGMQPPQPSVIIGAPPTNPSGMPFIGGPSGPSMAPYSPSINPPQPGLGAVSPGANPSTVVPGVPAYGTLTPSAAPTMTPPGARVPSSPYLPGNAPTIEIRPQMPAPGL